jgi:signal transduction histidine kinase
MSVAVIGLTVVGFLALDARQAPLRQLLFILLAAGFGLALVLGYLFFRRLSVSLLELTAAANDLGKGRLERRVRISARDDLAELAGVLNQMASALEEKVGEITGTVQAGRHSERHGRRGDGFGQTGTDPHDQYRDGSDVQTQRRPHYREDFYRGFKTSSVE